MSTPPRSPIASPAALANSSRTDAGGKDHHPSIDHLRRRAPGEPAPTPSHPECFTDSIDSGTGPTCTRDPESAIILASSAPRPVDLKLSSWYHLDDVCLQSELAQRIALPGPAGRHR